MRWTIVAAIVAVAALAVPAMAQQQMQEREAGRSTVLNVSAQGMSEARPDMATIVVGVTNEARTARAASEENARRMTALIRALRQAGVAERDIQTAQVRLDPRYDSRDNGVRVIVSYSATNTVQAAVRNVDATGRVVDAAVSADGNVVQGLRFGFQNPEAQLDRARRDAAQKAQRRAQLYADAFNMRLVRVISVTEAGAAAPTLDDEIVVTARRVPNEPTPVAPGRQQIWANISVSYELR